MCTRICERRDDRSNQLKKITWAIDIKIVLDDTLQKAEMLSKIVRSNSTDGTFNMVSCKMD